VISPRTIIWFVLLLGFSAGLKYDAYQEDKPCRDWKAAHPGVDPKTDVGRDIELPDGTHEVSFNVCNCHVVAQHARLGQTLRAGLVSIVDWIFAILVD
jgi:hypothetical protein